MEYNKLNGNNMKIIFIFSLVIFFTSCKNNNEEYIFNKDTFVLQNKELEEQIIKYKKFVYEADSTSISKGDSVTFHVFYKALNDSLDRFVIESIIDPEIVRTYRPYQSVIKVDGTDIFFHFACWEYKRSPKAKYVGLSNNAYTSFVKRYYPKMLEPVIINGIKMRVERTYDQELCYLTFKNGSLINVTKRGGLPDDRIPINIEGKIVNM